MPGDSQASRSFADKWTCSTERRLSPPWRFIPSPRYPVPRIALSSVCSQQSQSEAAFSWQELALSPRFNVDFFYVALALMQKLVRTSGLTTKDGRLTVQVPRNLTPSVVSYVKQNFSPQERLADIPEVLLTSIDTMEASHLDRAFHCTRV